jgi:outer membrane protein assembly factor BamB
MRTRSVKIILTLVLATPLFSAAPTAEWPGWRGPHRDGKSPDTGLLKEWPKDGPPLVWKVDGIGNGFSSVAVSRGMIYTAGDTGGRFKIFAFTVDGKPAWQIDHDAAWNGDPKGSRSTPVIDGGNLYIISGNGLIGCYDTKAGKKKWTRKMSEFGGGVPGWGYAESVLILKKLAIVTPGGKNCIVALDKATGKNVWMSQGFEAGAQYGSCLAFEFQKQPLIVAGTHGGIVCVSAANGRALWSNPWSTGNTANCPTPVYADGHVFWSNGYGKGGICMKLGGTGGRITAEQAWTTNDLVCHHGGFIVDGGYIYGNHEGGWSCLELATGKKMWHDRGVGKGSLCFADGMLFLFGEEGGTAGLAEATPRGFSLKGKFKVEGKGPSWAHPVVIGGRLYLRYDENLYCFDVKAQ